MGKDKNQARSTVPIYRQLRTKLIASFMVPVLCIIVLGVVSYTQASNAIISNYENSVHETMIMTNQYMDLVIDTVRSDYNLYLSNVNLSRYFKGELNETEGNNLVLSYTKEITRKTSSDTNVSNLYFLSANTPSIATATPSDVNAYDAYLETPEGAEPWWMATTIHTFCSVICRMLMGCLILTAASMRCVLPNIWAPTALSC